MFDRKYAARDRRRNTFRYHGEKLMMAKLSALKTERTTPAPDVGFDAVDLGLIDDLLDEHLRTLISPDIWARYTVPVPFCTVPEGGTDPKKYGGVMTRNPFRKPTEVKAELAILRSMSAEAKAKLTDELPPLPTMEQIIADAGGKVLSMPNVCEAADWHEQDGSI
jgi:hypothetical protein